MSGEKKLVIVESPSKAKTINKYLGKEFKVIASVGHIIDLPKNRLGVDLEHGFIPEYVPLSDKAKIINMLKKEAKNSREILVATDPDREGEAIAYHIASLFKDRRDLSRIEFNEITPTAIKNALEHPREIDRKKVDSQQARRVLDRIVGYKVSPILWKTVAKGLSAGRVQSVALRILCEREEEVEKFVPVEYWNFSALFETAKNEKYYGKLARVNGEQVDLKHYHIDNEDKAFSLKEEIESRDDYRIKEINIKNVSRKSPPPYTTSSFQQDAIRKLNMSAKQVMRVAQQLYEGVELGGRGNFGLITYMRTDSTRISGEALSAVRNLIKESFGEDYLPAKPYVYGKKKKAQDAHEAIRPTYLQESFSPDNIKQYLSRDQLRLYRIIWNRFLACQMKPAKFEETVIITGDDKFTFETKGERNVFKGFLAVYKMLGEENEESEEGKPGKIPHHISVEDPVQLLELESKQEFTKPPARYSESSLVKKLDQLGIGRPSTYAQIISTLLDRLYVEKEEKKLIPTELGKTVNKLLIKTFPELINVKFTALMEDDLDKIERDEKKYLEVMEDFYDRFSVKLKEVENNIKNIKKELEEPIGEKCEYCGSEMIIKWGRNGRFIACSNYPNCKNTRPLVVEEPQKINEKCPKCGADLVKKNGRYGEFIACMNYPDCKYTRPVTLGVKCPEKGCNGDVVVKKSKRGRVFYGCSNYPECKFVSWDKPVNKKCPACGADYLVEKKGKNKTTYLYCPSCKSKISDEN